MSLLSCIDQYLVAQHHKNHRKIYGRINSSKFGYTLTTLLVLYATFNEVMEKHEHGETVLMIIFIAIGILIAFYGALHVLREKKIERFEYRLKAIESLVILYTGFDKWRHIGEREGALSAYGLVFATAIIILFLAYLMQARMFYLKHKGVIGHE
jgi:hypothetical protein